MRGLRTAVAAAWGQTRDGFLSLSGSPRDLYLIFALKVLESYNYFSLSRSMTLYLTEEFGVSDYRAGTLYGAWGTLLTAYGFLLGGAIDVLGVKLSLIICFILNIGSRFIMASTNSVWVMLVMLLGPNTMAGALGVPVMTIGVKRFTTEANRGFCFSLFYSLMNAAALLQGMLMDVFRIGFKHGFNVASLSEHSLLNSGFRLFLASGCLTSLVGLGLTFFLSDGAVHAGPAKRTLSSKSSDLAAATGSEAEGGPSGERPASPEQPLLLGPEGSGSGTAEGAEADGGRAARERVASVEELLLPDRSATSASENLDGGPVVARKAAAAQHTDGSAVGDSAVALQHAGRPPAHEGEATAVGTPSKHKQQGRFTSTLESIKVVLSSKGFWKYMAMCIFTVNLKSIFRHLDATLPKYQLRAFGCDCPIGLIYSINPAMIVLLVPVVGAMMTGYQHFDMIHLGGYISALSPFWMVAFQAEWASALFVAMLSLGEAIWSPRWYDYSMSVAPNGREGIFTALASAPLFAAMLPTGMISGALLAAYCPDNGQCNAPGGEGGPGRRLLQAAARALGVGGDEPPVSECNGRALWLIVGCITLSSPLLILLTQRWIRPHPQDFARVHLLPTHRTETEGEHFDVNEADPTAMVENVYQARSEALEAPALVPAAEDTPLLSVHQHHPQRRPGSGAAGEAQRRAED